MDDKTAERRFEYKKRLLEKECAYGLKYFCDGTPNRSIVDTDKQKTPCPMYRICGIRQTKLFKTLGGNDYDD